MVSGQGWIVKAPVFQVIKVPFRDGKVRSELHPMALGLEVTMHGRFLKT